MASQFPLPFASVRELARFDPFDLFGNFFPAAGALVGLPVKADDLTALPRLDVHEDEQDVHVFAELPGVDAADVEVRIDGDTLVISGEKKAKHQGSTNSYHVMERSFGQFKRTITLPFNPDPGAVAATFDLGVLTVHVPKQARQDTSRRVEVRVGNGDITTASNSFLQDGQRMPAGPDSPSEPSGTTAPAH